MNLLRKLVGLFVRKPETVTYVQHMPIVDVCVVVGRHRADRCPLEPHRERYRRALARTDRRRGCR